ncbi:hypothetical protein D3C78_1894150 [compost metagenome]
MLKCIGYLNYDCSTAISHDIHTAIYKFKTLPHALQPVTFEIKIIPRYTGPVIFHFND